MIGQRGGRLAMTKWRGRNLCDTCRLMETRSNLDAKVRTQLLGKAAYKSQYHRILLARMMMHKDHELFFRVGPCRTTKTSSATEISMIRHFHVAHFATMTTTLPSQIVRCRLPVVLNGSWEYCNNEYLPSGARHFPFRHQTSERQSTISAAHAHYSYNKLLNYGDLPPFDYANRLGPSVRCCPSCGSRISRLLLARGVRLADILKRDGGAEEAPAAAAAAACGYIGSAAVGAGAAELSVSPADMLSASARA
jgi:hypothetical protein